MKNRDVLAHPGKSCKEGEAQDEMADAEKVKESCEVWHSREDSLTMENSMDVS